MAVRQLLLPGVILLTLLAAGCEHKTTLETYNTRVVTLPDGAKVRAEVMSHPEDMMRGMMFRKSLAEKRGMIFLHGEAGLYPYWMYQVEIPLDIIWMDQNGRVVEISPDTPPCKTEASKCPQHGGTKMASMILELNAGAAEKHNIRVGSRIRQ
jgi:uncharacterized protein